MGDGRRDFSHLVVGLDGTNEEVEVDLHVPFVAKIPSHVLRLTSYKKRSIS